MRISKLLVVSFVCGSLLGCSSNMNSVQPVNTQTQNINKATQPLPKCNKKKNPMEVSFYSNGKMPNNPYTVLGQATVSKYNLVGIKRQDATIHDAMRTMAASMGGDAIIDVKKDYHSVSGTVIMYHQNIAV